MSFNGKPIKGVLLDITGVLAESSAEGDGQVIFGSVEAVKKLTDKGLLKHGKSRNEISPGVKVFPFSGIQVRFLTNETQRTRRNLMEKLHRLGFSMNETDIFPPALAMSSIALEKNLRPFLLVHENVLPDLAAIPIAENYDSVVIGDAVDEFSYQNLNKAFRVLMASGGPLYTLGKGRFYREDGELTLDVGAFAAALAFAADREAIVCGKPAPNFFATAIKDMGVRAEETLMVGDDIVSDVGGAQACGIKGILVRTGKFQPQDENHPNVTPDKIVNNLAEIADIIVSD
ncbi:hypothetical protein TCAL_05569 [Tigriopus californicus]|uniref:Phospholysine phosphohistidine inorganic pyrophosphate phosphatase n=1 Tax=Tigriopus californicus TaxID=6832 RepID=A0A553NC76_TIGCA|nr:hypothetical protein TCAL_05569 [Tigriopus californicus]